MSYYTMAFMGMATFGSLLAGTLAHSIPPTPIWFVGKIPLAGAQWTVILNGVALVLGAAWFMTELPCLAARSAADLPGDGHHALQPARWQPSRSRTEALLLLPASNG